MYVVNINALYERVTYKKEAKIKIVFFTACLKGESFILIWQTVTKHKLNTEVSTSLLLPKMLLFTCITFKL